MPMSTTAIPPPADKAGYAGEDEEPPKDGFFRNAILRVVDPASARTRALEKRRRIAKEQLQAGIQELRGLYGENLRQVHRCTQQLEDAMDHVVHLNEMNDARSMRVTSLHRMERKELEMRIMEAMRNKKNAENVYQKTGVQIRVLERDLEMLNDKDTNNKIVSVMKSVALAMNTKDNEREYETAMDAFDDASENRGEFHDGLQKMDYLIDASATPLGDTEGEEMELVKDFKEVMRVCDERSSAKPREYAQTAVPDTNAKQRGIDAFSHLALPIPPSHAPTIGGSNDGDDDPTGGNRLALEA